MTEQRKLQLAVEIDGSGAKQGTEQIKADVASMAQAVAKSGEDASKGLDKIGERAQLSGEKVEAATKKFEASIKKATELQTALAAGPRGSAGFIETRAAQQGADIASLKPMLDQLRAIEAAQKGVAVSSVAGAAGLNAYGQSARQTAAALRGVPAQLTDIVTSLQGGQKPITVLLQQGGQLKDMFGGIVPAAKALGGAVLGLINPFTLTAGALGALGIAALQGEKELRAFENAATITGNAIGVSASQFTTLRDSITGIGSTKGKAAEVLTEIAASGLTASKNVGAIAEAAILMEKATGQATSKTIAQFAELAKSPLEAAVKLNEQYNFLTAAVYQQIKALDEQGRAQEAVNVAESSYAAAMKQRAETVIANAGLIEKAWRGIAGTAKAAWDAMLGIGRDQSLGQKLASAAADVARIQAQIAGVGAFGSTGGGAATGGASAARKAALENELAIAKQTLATAFRRAEIEEQNTQAIAARALQVKALGDFDKAGVKFLGEKVKMEREIVEARNLGLAAGKSEEQIQTRILEIRKSYEKKGGTGAGSSGAQSELANLRARVQAEQEYLTQLRLVGKEADKRNAGEVLTGQLQEQLKGKLDAKTRSIKEQMLALAQQSAETLKLTAVEIERIKLNERIQKDQDKVLEGMQKAGDSIRERAIAQENANATFGLGKAALEELTLAQYRNSLASLEATNNVIPGAIEAIRAQITEQERLIAALKKGEELTAGKKLSDAYADEAKKAYEDWEKTNERIADSFVDNLMRGGKSVAQYLKDLFRTLVLQPALKPIGTAFAGIVNGGPAAAGGIPGGGGLLGSVGSAFGSVLGSGVTGTALGTFGAGISGGFSAGLGGGLELAASLAAEGAVSGALGAAIGALGPLAAVAGIAYMLLKDRGETRSGGQYVNGQFIGGPSGGQIGADGVSQAIGATMVSINATLKALGSTSYLDKLVSGLEASEKGKGFAYAGGALSTGAVFGQGIDGNGYNNRRGNLTPEEATKAFQAELEQATLQALQAATDIPEAIAKQLRGVDVDALADEARQALLSSINATIVAVEGFGRAVELLPFENLKNLSFDAASALIAAGGGLEQFTASLSSYYENFYTEEEKRRNVAGNIQATLAKAGLNYSLEGILNGSREGFRDLVEAAIALGPEGEVAYQALLSVNAAFASIVPATVTAQDSLEELSDTVSVTLAGALESLRNPLRTIEDIAQSIFGLEQQGAGLKVELLRAQGNNSGADALQRAIDTAGFTDAEIALYDYNAALTAQIKAIQETTAAQQTAAEEAKRIAEQAAQDAQRIAEKAAADRVALEERFYANFTSPEYRRQQTATQIADTLNTSGLGIAISVEEVLSATRPVIAQYMQQFIDMGAAGAPFVDLMLSLGDAFASITDPITETGDTVTEVAETLEQALLRLRNPIRTIQDIAQSIVNLEGQGAGLGVELLRAQGNTAGADAAQRALDTAGFTDAEKALYDYNAAIRAQIQALNDAATAAQAAAAAEQRIADERFGLEGRLLQAQGNTAALRERELAALDPANRAILAQIFALEDQTAAANAAAQAQEKAAAKAKAIADERAGLQQRIYQLEGNTAALRKLELATLDPSNRALQRRIYTLEDEAEAAQKAAAIAQERLGLEKTLLGLQGNTAALRALELAALDPANRALQEQIYALQDQQSAAEAAAQAAEQLADSWKSLTDSMLDEVARIRGEMRGDGAGAYSYAQGAFATATAQARAGSQSAAGMLPQLSQTLLSLAANNAVSLIDLRRIQGQVAASLETTAGMLGGTTSGGTVTAPNFSTSPGMTAGGQQGYADLVSLVGELKSEVASLKGLLQTANGHQQRIADATNGNPEQSIPVSIIEDLTA